MTIRKSTTSASASAINGMMMTSSANAASTSSSAAAAANAATGGSHTATLRVMTRHHHHHHPNVVIIASPSRTRTSLLQRQVSRALEIIDLYDDSRMDVDLSNTRLKRSGAPSPTKGTALFQISPNPVKRKRSQSLSSINASVRQGHHYHHRPRHHEVEDMPMTSATIGLTVTPAMAATTTTSIATTTTTRKRTNSKLVTPSKRCGSEKKKKKKVDVIERALQRFRADCLQHVDQRRFTFPSISHGSTQRDESNVQTCETDSGVVGEERQHREGSESSMVRVHVGVAAAQGARAYMEDRFSVTTDLFAPNDDDTARLQSPASLVAIFDGHNGAAAAEYASQRFQELLGENAFLRDLCRRPPFEMLRSDDVDQIHTVLCATFATIDEEVLKFTMNANKRDGATVLLGLMICGKMFIANLGDSRGVYGATSECGVDNVRRVSVDHKPDLEVEKTRVEEAGGKVIFSGCWRVAHDELPLRLAVSRSLGDHPLKANLPSSCTAPLVSAVPDIQVLDISGMHDVLVFATDGLWDRLSDEDAIRIVRERVDESILRGARPIDGAQVMQRAANALVEAALVKRSMDNITAMVIGFTPGQSDTVEEPCEDEDDVAEH